MPRPPSPQPCNKTQGPGDTSGAFPNPRGGTHGLADRQQDPGRQGRQGRLRLDERQPRAAVRRHLGCDGMADRRASCGCCITPHPLVVIAFFVGLTWVLQRNWKVCLGVFIGFLFILNQGYWKPTAESLTLILSSCVVCMGLGVPIGIAAAHRPRLYTAMVPVLDLMQTLPTFVYLIPAIVFFGLGAVPGPDRHRDLRAARPDPPDPSRRLDHPHRAVGGRNRLRRHPHRSACGRSNCPTPSRRSWPA